PVIILVSLAGGSHFVTIHESTVLKIWSAVHPSERETNLLTDDRSPLLAYSVGLPVYDVVYRAPREDGGKIAMALRLVNGDPEISWNIRVIEFQLSRGMESVDVTEYPESPALVGYYFAGLHLNDARVAVLGGALEDSAMHINIHDYRRNLLWVINTELDTFVDPIDVLHWDAFNSGEDLIVFREDGRTVTFYSFNIANLLTTTPERLDSRMILNCTPDSIRTVEFAIPSLCADEHLDWVTIHPWGTPNHRTLDLVPAVGSARYIDDDGMPTTTRLMFRHDINPMYVSRLLRSPDMPIERAHRFELVISNATDIPQPETSLWIASTCGKRWIWIGRVNEGDLQLATLLLPEAPYDSGAGLNDIRILDIPLDLSTVDDLDFYDESATLILVTREGDPFEAHKVHLFRF
ncbi:hypothetical protein FRB90_002628, partial [Tulasnella sp. 427]